MASSMECWEEGKKLTELLKSHYKDEYLKDVSVRGECDGSFSICIWTKKKNFENYSQKSPKFHSIVEEVLKYGADDYYLRLFDVDSQQ